MTARLRTAFHWLAKRPGRWFTRESAALLALLALATVVRLPFMPFPGYWHDLASYTNWGNELVSHGFSNLYAVKWTNQTLPGANTSGGVVLMAINYPPGMPYLFGGLTLLYNFTLAHFTHAKLIDMVIQYGVGPSFAKLAILLADIATTALLYREARKRHSQRFAWLAAASYAFSPATLYDGVIWGQTDAMVMLPVLIAVFAIFSDRYKLSGVSLAIAVLVKLQIVIFIPLVLLYIWRWRRRQDFARFTTALLGAATLLMLPVMIPRFQIFDMLYNMRAMTYNKDFQVSPSGFNYWWLARLNWNHLGSSLLGVNIELVAETLFVMATIVIGIQIWRHQEPAYLCLGLALEACGFFTFMGGQHERYLFPFIPLILATLIVSDRKSSDRLLILYVAGTILCALNMLVTVDAFLTSSSPMIPYLEVQPVNDFIVYYFGLFGFAIGAYVVATFCYGLWIYLAGKFAPLPAEEPSRSLRGARDEAYALHLT